MKMIKVMKLTYSNEDFMNNLRTVTPIEDVATKMDLDPFPSLAELATFAEKAYSNNDNERMTDGWGPLTTARNETGYFGCLYVNPSRQQLVLAHRGTDPSNLGALFADLDGVCNNNPTDFMSSAITLGDKVKSAILELNQQDGVRFTLAITGHSLGGWLAQITAVTLKHLKIENNEFSVESNIDEGILAHTVVFDSPGVQDMVLSIQREYGRYDFTPYSMFLSLDITNLFMAVNLVNDTGFHLGTMYQVQSNLVCTSRFKHFLSNFTTHSINNYTDAFENGNVKLFQVKDWPHGWWWERRLVHQREKAQGSHFPEPGAGHYNVGEEDLGNSIRWNHFSEVEQKLVNLLSMVTRNEIKNSEIEIFINQSVKQSFQDLFPKFIKNRKEKTFTFDSELQLKKFVKNIKNAPRWLSPKLQDVMEKQLKLTASRFLLDMFSQECQDSIPALPECKDTLGLYEFAKNDDRILYIQTADCSLEMARIFNILENYPDIDPCVFLNWESLKKINKNLTTKGLPLDNDRLNLFVINIGSTTEIGLVQEVLQHIFSKFKECSKKKAVIVSHKNSVLFDFVKYFESELAIHCVPLSAQECLEFKIKDLKDSSRRELFSKEFITLGEQAMSLNTLLGENCQSLVSIDDVLKPFLKEILMNESFTLNIPNNLLKFVQSDTMFLKINREVSLMELLHEKKSFLFVSSDIRQQLEPQLQEVPGAAERVLDISGSSKEDFHQACLDNLSIHIAYWLALTDGCIYLKQIYNRSLYLPRQFQDQSVVDLEKLVQKKNDANLFVFVGVTNKATLMGYLKASSKVEELFSTNLKFKIQESAENAKGIDRCVNKHTLEVVKEGGGYLLVWQDSQGALDSLLPCLSTYSQPLNEEDLCARKAVIISDLPGMGKSTTLTSLYRHLVNSWVLGMNMRDRRADITNLPAQMTIESVANFLFAGTDSEPATLSLLQFCLQSQGSRQIHVLLDGFDELRDEDAVKKILKLCHFLKNETTAKIIVTTRDSYKDVLINGLSTVATIFEEITDEIQLSFLVNFWNSHAVLGQKDGRLRLFAQHLYEAAHKKLGGDTIRLIGIPLHMRMLAEAFLQQAEQFSRNTESIPNIIGMNNVYGLFKKFTTVKRDIYLNEKISLASNMTDNLGNNSCETLTVTHCVLAFEILDPEFKNKYLLMENIKRYIPEMNRFGLTQWNRENHCDFIHRTFAEYFCSQLIVLWLRREDFRYMYLPIEEWFLSNLLTKKDFKVVRKFMDEHLAEVTLAEESKQSLYNNMSKCWSTDAEAFRDENGKTALHVAVEEENANIIKLLLGGLVMEQTREAFESFLLARDYDGNTALKTGLIILFPEDYKFDFRSNLPAEEGIKLMLTHLSCELKYKLLLNTVFEDQSHDLLSGAFERNFISHISELFSEFLPKLALSEKEQEDIQLALKRISVLRKKDHSRFRIFFENFVLDQNDIEERKFLLLAQKHYGTDINIECSAGNYERVNLFIQINREVVNSRGSSRTTPLHCAAIGGHIKLVKLLHQHGARLNDRDSTGRTALSFAAESGYKDIVEYLISSKEIIDQRDNNAQTPLHYALLGKNWPVAKYLLESGTDPNISDCDGRTPLMYAVDPNLSPTSSRNDSTQENQNTVMKRESQNDKRERMEITEKLISISKDITKLADNGMTLLHFAIEGGDLAIVKYLFSKVKVDIDCRDNGGKTLLHYAVVGGDMAIVEYLISKAKVDINSRDNDGKTPLHYAVKRGQMEMVEYLISEAKVDIDCLDNDGKTPLIYAIEGWPLAIEGWPLARYLLESGADPNISDCDGRTPLMYAVDPNLSPSSSRNDSTQVNLNIVRKREIENDKRERMKITEKLISISKDITKLADNGMTLLHFAIEGGDLAIVKYLFSKVKGDIDCRDNEGKTPLIYAIEGKSWPLAEYLLESGADPNIPDRNNKTFLMYAAEKSKIFFFHNTHQIQNPSKLDIVKKIISFSKDITMDINKSDNCGKTPLHYAVRGGGVETVEYLISELKVENINCLDNGGKTPLHYALERDEWTIAMYLLNSGADRDITDNDGNTALDYATKEIMLKYLKFIKTPSADPIT